MKRRVFLAGSALGVASLASPSLAQPAGSRVLKFVPQADLAIVDPLRTTAYVTRNHGYLVFDTLYGLDEHFNVQPQMVEGHTVEQDGKLWRLTLREGLKFHDGLPVLARDVVASLRRWGRVDGFGGILLEVTDELSAPSDRVVQFRLKHPFRLLPEALAKLPGFMPCVMPERIVSIDPRQAITEMVGSGPFRFIASERVQGARFVYEKFGDYVPRPSGTPSRTAGPKVAHLDRIEWHVLPDPATAASALQSGEVDWLESPSLDLLPMLHRARHLSIELKDTTGNIGNMRLNHLTKPFDNPEIRRIVLRAVRQADFMSAVAGSAPGGWADGVGYFCPGTPLAEGLPPLAREPDTEKSKQALRAAGYAGEPVVVLAATDYPSINAMAQVGSDLLRGLGMNVDFQAIDWGTVQQRRLSKEPVGRGGWSLFFTFIAGADTFNPAVNHSIRGNGVAGTPGWPQSAELERLRTEWLSAPDLAAQKAACAMLQQQAQIDVPYVPLGQFFQPFAFHRSVSGILPGFSTFYNVRKG
ncbi:ABC transporter substrate-binding protein [Belnapia rosea]|uniref:ABC transporter substrate-binding protein n=1 Tax=Belnapia rosea TaxID=938405 RepID=UPI000888F77F|nr:ABC transporter substrate-binding protein [Belnapia rosea]SDB74577.1 peptide/nickel transport system substrate-binding protein [Belnapia rosea]